MPILRATLPRAHAERPSLYRAIHPFVASCILCFAERAPSSSRASLSFSYLFLCASTALIATQAHQAPTAVGPFLLCTSLRRVPTFASCLPSPCASLPHVPTFVVHLPSLQTPLPCDSCRRTLHHHVTLLSFNRLVAHPLFIPPCAQLNRSG
ncbi:hypothetical protein AMTR_s00004p00253540 [Amborella trichopoda]|uniref:Uncharacterized protein n=1 Tax=Amborella trichopoda TaxID=13333 RepID=W1NEB3_AMBTC|nr:hypothetical protein AMTR_s00004p00253540 [Amborella trichopoda]